MQHLVFNRKCRPRTVHTGRLPLQLEPLANLFKVDSQLISQMDIAVHHASHKLDSVVRLQPSGLVADHSIGRRMRFVKSVVGKFFEQVKNLGGLLLVDTILHRPLFKLGAFFGHFFSDLFTHRTAQQIRAAEAIPRHNLSNLHNLFLVNNNPLRLFKNMVNRRMYRLPLFQPVLHLAVSRDVLHRARAVERNKRNNILDTCGLHALERIHHPRTFHLKHGHSLGPRIELV